ncbi:hypothetical protein AVEN_85307-1, partial [Araneus ventricosus]
NSPAVFTFSSEVTRGSFLDGPHKFEPQFMKNLSAQSLQAFKLHQHGDVWPTTIE